MKNPQYYKIATRALFDAVAPAPNVARIHVLALTYAGNALYLSHDNTGFQIYDTTLDGYLLIPFDPTTKVQFLSGCRYELPVDAS